MEIVSDPSENKVRSGDLSRSVIDFRELSNLQENPDKVHKTNSVSFKSDVEAAEILDTASTDSSLTIGDDDSGEVRETWTGGCDFMFQCIGYAVGLGNIWRFPYLCYTNGGGAFLIPYFFFAFTIAIPLFFMEISFGQFASLSPITIWRISPIFKGLGYSMVIVCFQVCIYYNVILAWNFMYLFSSFYEILPWTTCTNEWNTPCCTDKTFNNPETCNGTKTTSVEEFWEKAVLQRSSGIENLGGMRWTLAGYLALAWSIVFVCLFRGIRVSGKVVYFTALAPYVILIALLIRGLTLKGSIEGIKYYIVPDFEKLLHIKVWVAAGSQIFYSMGAAWGVLVTMSSYNKFNNNVLNDTYIVPTVNCSTSIFAGFVVFAILGYMAEVAGKKVKDVVRDGFGLVFIAYPEAAGSLPAGNFWSICFFLMILLLGLDSQFSMFETMTSSFVDEYPKYRKKKIWITLAVIFIQYGLGLLMVTEGGIYILVLLDSYSGTFSVMVISFCEGLVLSWIYGLDRFCKDIEMMIGRKPPLIFQIMWKYVSPVITIIVYTIGISQQQAVKYSDYTYPAIAGWAAIIVIGFSSLIPIPAIAIYSVCKESGPLLKRIKTLAYPVISYGPANEQLYKEYIEALHPKEMERSNRKLSIDIGCAQSDKERLIIREQTMSKKSSQKASQKASEKSTQEASRNSPASQELV